MVITISDELIRFHTGYTSGIPKISGVTTAVTTESSVVPQRGTDPGICFPPDLT